MYDENIYHVASGNGWSGGWLGDMCTATPRPSAPPIGFHRGNPLTEGQTVLWKGWQGTVVEAGDAAFSAPADTERGIFFDMLVAVRLYGATSADDQTIIVGTADVTVIDPEAHLKYGRC